MSPAEAKVQFYKDAVLLAMERHMMRLCKVKPLC